MNLALFGSSGATGFHLVNQALAAGHHVTAFARNPDGLPFAPHDRLTRKKGDLLEPATLDLQGHDAVVSVAGPRKRGPTKMFSEGCRNLDAAMGRAGIQRLVFLTALGAEPNPDLPFPVSFVFKQIVSRLLRDQYDDMILAEQVLAATALHWTSVRATGLTNGKHSGKIRYSINAPLHHPVRISRADLAQHMLEIVPNAATHRAFTEPAW